MKETGIVPIAWRNVSMTKIAEVLNAKTTALIKPMDIAPGGRKTNVCFPLNLPPEVTEKSEHASTKVSILI